MRGYCAWLAQLIERRIGMALCSKDAEVAGLIPVPGFSEWHVFKPRVCHRQFLCFAWADPRARLIFLFCVVNLDLLLFY